LLVARQGSEQTAKIRLQLGGTTRGAPTRKGRGNPPKNGAGTHQPERISPASRFGSGQALLNQNAAISPRANNRRFWNLMASLLFWRHFIMVTAMAAANGAVGVVPERLLQLSCRMRTGREG
jgi:hypothetical protein